MSKGASTIWLGFNAHKQTTTTRYLPISRFAHELNIFDIYFMILFYIYIK